jgi:hypothetical protein
LQTRILVEDLGCNTDMWSIGIRDYRKTDI